MFLQSQAMRAQGSSPLDLNNFPEDHGKQPLDPEFSSTTTTASTEDSSIKGLKKKKKQGKENDKAYECRFCSLKFCKSQALGGHMNRHRQERETEILNRARQIVYNTDSFAGGATHLGFRDLAFGNSPSAANCFQSLQSAGCGGADGGAGGGAGAGPDPRLNYRPVYPKLPTLPQQPLHVQQTGGSYFYPCATSASPLQPSYTPPPPTTAPTTLTVPFRGNDHHYGGYGVGRVIPAGNRPADDGASWACSRMYSAGQYSADPAGIPSTDRFWVDQYEQHLLR